MKTILYILLLLLTGTLFSQQNEWQLFSTASNEAFRFYERGNGMTGILDETNSKLITYHSSAYSGLIVRTTTPLNNPTNISLQELGWIDPNSSMRGGGFDIARKVDNNGNVGNKLYLYGLGSTKNECDEFTGVSLFVKEITPQQPNDPLLITRKNILLSGITDRDNNGISDFYGNYFFCNPSINKLYATNMFESSTSYSTFNLSNDYIIKFRKMHQNGYTHIVGLETNREYIIYIKSNSNGYTVMRYKLDDVANLNNVKMKSTNSFDLGLLMNDHVELMFLTEDHKLYSVDLTQNMNGNLNNKANLKYTGSVNQLERIRGLVYLENGKCLLVPYSYIDTGANPSHFYFDGLNMNENYFGYNIIGGTITEKIFTLNNFQNTKVFISRNNNAEWDEDYKRVRLFKVAPVNQCDNYELPLNESLSQSIFSIGGGQNIMSISKVGNNLVFGSMEFINNKVLNQIGTSSNSTYINSMIPTTITPINNNEFVAGLYLGPYIQRYQIQNGNITPIGNQQKIMDSFKKIFSMTSDGEKIYIGLYHNSQSTENTSNIYVYNITQNLLSQTPYLTISETNFVSSLHVTQHESGNKYLYGIAQNNANEKYFIFRKNISTNTIVEKLELINNNQLIKDFEIIDAVDGNKYLYFITQGQNNGNLYRMIIKSSNNLSLNDIEHLRTFSYVPRNIEIFLNKHLIISFECNRIGFLTQDENSFALEFDEIPLPTEDYQNVLYVDDNQKSIFVGTVSGIGLNQNNKGGRVYKLTLPEYLGFSYQFDDNLNITSSKIISGDFNGDGYDDIMATSNDVGALKWSMYINNHSEDFNFHSDFNLSSYNSDFVFTGDFNGDGYDDIGVNRYSDPFSMNLGEWIFYLNDQNGNFTSQNQYRYKWGMIPDDIVVGDFNGDEYDDIAIFKKNDGWYIKLNNTQNNFLSSYVKYDWLTNPDFVYSGDFNGDGFDDIGIKLTNSELGEWVIRFNNQDMGFDSQKRHKWDIEPNDVFIGDFNSDNLADLGIKRIEGGLLPNSQDNLKFRLNYGFYYAHLQNKYPDKLRYLVDTSNDIDISLFPNPATDKITIDSNFSFSIEIFDTFGNRVFLSNKFENIHIIDLKNMKKGAYFVKAFINGSNQEVTKIFIKK